MDYSQFLSMQAELSLLAVIVILFVADLFMSPSEKGGKGIYNTPLPVVLLGLHTLLNLLPTCPFTGQCVATSVDAFGGMYVSNAMMAIVKSILNIGTLVVFLMAHRWLSRDENLVKQGEFYLITLFTLLGMHFMISSGHFLMFFIGLEMASVPMAAIVAFDKHRYESAEAAAKFILLALFSAGLLLYGISLLYGATGSLYFDAVGRGIVEAQPLALLGLVLFISGMGFKISLVPFHLWTADTYEGAPTTVTSFMSVISKGAASFVLLLVLIKVFPALLTEWNLAFVWIIIASITLANLFALRQKNLKRFMAFSAISQAGYIVLAVLGGSSQGMTALVYYLLVYLVANLGAFAVMNVIEQSSGQITMDAYNGLYRTNPKLAFFMTLCLFSLAGIPPFAGFFSKFFVFMAAFKAGYHWVVLVALINTVISLYYYLLIVKAMYINPSDAPIATFKSDCYSRTAMVICLLGVVLLGIVGACYNYIGQFAYGLDNWILGL
ncbi:MAG: NADH-quinone oxidoreductase subunit N [Bacteroidaceae bacterium]|nr:NADH-quinone oxidoreductase subunit N [Bacteroidaceae bacterium]